MNKLNTMLDPTLTNKLAGRPGARRWMIAAALVTAVAATAVTGASIAADAGARADGKGFGMRHGRHQGPIDAAMTGKHIDKMVERIVGDGTAQQKARLSEIAKSAFADLKGPHAEFKAGNEKIRALLMQTAIDRIALEKLRAEQVARMDAISKRLLSALEDAAEVLTPEQRLRFAEHLHRRMR